ncbi:IniB N-terminal domain-containing protein [Kutzneria sp. CA-103260]|uniref:IniB N-terminal domain-containing protein n=1 Tax=Kutzneria sp. CA-103260 TaxID=2802641 RepID=UPI001BACE6CF|nr:IniB N-terminal domain-containing protein [Kutzneria sp. CA-103260]
MTTLQDFTLKLLSDPAALTQFASNPEGVLQSAGLGDITAADVHEILPLVMDYAPTHVVEAFEQTVAGAVPGLPAAGAIDTLQQLAHQLTVALPVDALPVGALPVDGLTSALPVDGLTSALPVDGLTGALPVDGLTSALPVDGLTGALPVDGLTSALPIDGLTGALPVDGLTSALPVDGLTGALPVDGLAGALPVDGVERALPVDGLTGALPVDGLTSALPVDGLTGALPVDGLTSALPVDGLTGALPVGALPVAGLPTLPNLPLDGLTGAVPAVPGLSALTDPTALVDEVRGAAANPARSLDQVQQLASQVPVVAQGGIPAVPTAETLVGTVTNVAATAGADVTRTLDTTTHTVAGATANVPVAGKIVADASGHVNSAVHAVDVDGLTKTVAGTANHITDITKIAASDPIHVVTSIAHDPISAVTSVANVSHTLDTVNTVANTVHGDQVLQHVTTGVDATVKDINIGNDNHIGDIGNVNLGGVHVDDVTHNLDVTHLPGF